MPQTRAIKVLEETFGFKGFREGQEEAIEAVLGGENVLAVMPTGAGKSLCFQVPALVKGGLSIVISPLIALMQNQVSALRLSGVNAAAINSSQSREENVEIWRRVADGEINLLYLAPERLMTERMLSAIERATRQKISRLELPTTETVNNKRIADFKQKITDTLAVGELGFMQGLVEQYRQEHDVPGESQADRSGPGGLFGRQQ